MLITIGVLFLLDQMGHAHWMDFSFTWPAILIVAGLMKLLEHSASMNGHVPREYGPTLQSRDQRSGMSPITGQPIPPGASGYTGYPTQGPVATAPPNPPAGFITPGQPPDDKGGTS